MQLRTEAVFGVCGFQDDPHLAESRKQSLKHLFCIEPAASMCAPGESTCRLLLVSVGSALKPVWRILFYLSAGYCLVTSWNLYSEVTHIFDGMCIREGGQGSSGEPHNSVRWSCWRWAQHCIVGRIMLVERKLFFQ